MQQDRHESEQNKTSYQVIRAIEDRLRKLQVLTLLVDKRLNTSQASSSVMDTPISVASIAASSSTSQPNPQQSQKPRTLSALFSETLIQQQDRLLSELLKSDHPLSNAETKSLMEFGNRLMKEKQDLTSSIASLVSWEQGGATSIDTTDQAVPRVFRSDAAAVH
jgi:hypothetical protein